MKKHSFIWGIYAVLLAATLAIGGATFNRLHTWNPGDVLNATDLNNEFNNVLSNGNAVGWGGYEDTLAHMQSTENPYPSGSPFQGSSLADDIQQLRYMIQQITGSTYWYIANPAPFSAIDSGLPGVTISNDGSYPNSEMDVVAAGSSFTVSITSSGGVNKLDTGTVANSTWYYLWVISNGTTTGGLFSLSSTAPTMPSGYIYKKLIGAVYVNSSGNFISIKQQGNKVTTTETTVATAPSAGYAAVNLSAFVPTIARKVSGTLTIQNTTSGYATDIYVAADVNGLGQRIYSYTNASGATTGYVGYDQVIWNGSQQIFWSYAVSGGSMIASISRSGWEY
jgi:hypothetical protein